MPAGTLTHRRSRLLAILLGACASGCAPSLGAYLRDLDVDDPVRAAAMAKPARSPEAAVPRSAVVCRFEDARGPDERRDTGGTVRSCLAGVFSLGISFLLEGIDVGSREQPISRLESDLARMASDWLIAANTFSSCAFDNRSKESVLRALAARAPAGRPDLLIHGEVRAFTGEWKLASAEAEEARRRGRSGYGPQRMEYCRGRIEALVHVIDVASGATVWSGPIAAGESYGNEVDFARNRTEPELRNKLAVLSLGAFLAATDAALREHLGRSPPAAAAVPPAARARAAAYHDAAVAIGRWLESVAVTTVHGARWPRAPESGQAEADASHPSAASLYSGSAGVVLFLLELAARTPETAKRARVLALARAGADELLATLPEECEGEGCGLYTGIAGIGFTLEAAFRATGDPRYRDGARRCVDALHGSARLAGAGIEWSATTDIISGSAGIGCFLLAMHEQEGDGLALELATRAGRRLLELSRREAVGRSWRMDPGFPRVMPNFSHGTAGVAWFLARLHEATGEAAFLDAARDGADHLLSIADRSDDGLRIHHHTPGGADLYYLGWCHGPCGTARLFTRLERLTAEASYGDAARGGARSVMTSGLPQRRLPGFWNNVGLCCGSAGVIEFMLERARATGDASHVRFAEIVADDLLARGTRDERGLRFEQAEHRTRPERLEAQTGCMQGAAGIGLALLHLAAFERGEPASDLVLPDSP